MTCVEELALQAYNGDDRRIFLGLKVLILGFFGVRKFWQVFFGYLDLSRDFLRYLEQSEDL